MTQARTVTYRGIEFNVEGVYFAADPGYHVLAGDDPRPSEPSFFEASAIYLADHTPASFKIDLLELLGGLMDTGRDEDGYTVAEELQDLACQDIDEEEREGPEDGEAD